MGLTYRHRLRRSTPNRTCVRRAWRGRPCSLTGDPLCSRRSPCRRRCPLTAKRFPVFDDIVSTSDVVAAAELVAEARARPAPVGLDHSILPYSVGEYAWNLRTASGCPFSCSYCQDRSAQRTLDEIDGGLYRLAPLLEPETHIHYCDSVLGRTARRVVAVCDVIERLDHGMRLSRDLRPELLRPELLSALVRAGFSEIRVGLDSADQNFLTDNDRTARATALTEVLTRVKSSWADLYVSVYLVTGLPGSTAATLPKNLSLIDDLLTDGLADQIKHHLYVPYPLDGFPTSHSDVRVTNGLGTVRPEQVPLLRVGCRRL